MLMRLGRLRQRSFLPFCPTAGLHSGTDSKDTYLKALQVIPRVTASGADGVREMYPTMRNLFEAYEARKDSRSAREGLLVNARVGLFRIRLSLCLLGVVGDLYENGSSEQTGYP